MDTNEATRREQWSQKYCVVMDPNELLTEKSLALSLAPPRAPPHDTPHRSLLTGLDPHRSLLTTASSADDNEHTTKPTRTTLTTPFDDVCRPSFRTFIIYPCLVACRIPTSRPGPRSVIA